MLTRAMTDQEMKFEQTLAFHCAPAMAGIKSADLISWPGDSEGTRAMIENFSVQMKHTGICFRVLCFCRGRSLVLVYRRDRLEQRLAQDEVRSLLKRDGYPVEQGMEAMLDYLAKRMLECADFPHEVGLFLGYPVEDVEGFRKNDGRGFKFCGLWKVYSDEERAQECFRRYSCCRQALCRRVQGGCPLNLVFRTARAA